MKTLQLILFASLFSLIIFSCEKDDDGDTNVNPDLEYALGARGDEDDSKVPTNIYFGSGNLPSSHDLSQFLPPIGDQGNYGTCVSWALGYNLKTALEAIDKNYSPSDLSSSNRQFSPKDLFLSIPNDQKGAACNGTYLNSALEIMQNRGIATVQTAPYTDLGDCSQSAPSSWTQEASNNKIKSFRKIAIEVAEIKSNIANNRPVGFAAKLGDNFMQWNSNDVISGHSSFDNVGQHAFHAMTVIGYDDNKGPNGAFKVVNSWGQRFGDQGFIWVDYRFFTSGDFTYRAYVATNDASDVDPDNPVDPKSNGLTDLIPYGFSDEINPDGSTNRDRTFTYNVFNVGSETANASSDWGLGYIYYNAFDAEDYGIILYDYYSDDFGNRGENGRMQTGPGINNWWNHVDIEGGQSASVAVFNSVDNFTWNYEIPRITGYYYLVLIADIFDVLGEKNSANNYFYFTDEYGDPIWFEEGIPNGIQGGASDQLVDNNNTKLTESHQSPSQRSERLANAYTKDEISKMLVHLKKTGQLKELVSQYQATKTANSRTK